MKKQLPATAGTTTQLEIKQQQLQVAKQKANQTLLRWKNHLDGNLEARIPIAEITLANGLKDRRFFQLKKHTDERMIIVIIAKQIEGLKGFLNVKNNFTPDQVVDTAELIAEEFDDLSFTAFQDCLNRIKMAKPPFDKALYESIDGRKLFEYMCKYRDFQTQHLENNHLDNKQKAEYFSLHNLPAQATQAISDSIDKMRKKQVAIMLDKPIKTQTPKQKAEQALIVKNVLTKNLKK